MPLVHYPIASEAYEALALLKAGKASRAAREKEAENLAGQRVAFVTQSLGPVFETREQGLEAYAGLIGDDRVCQLVCRIKDAPRGRSRPTQATFTDGKRWPEASKPAVSVWQLSLSFWKTLPALSAKPVSTEVKGQPRILRKNAAGEALTPEEILALSQSPLLAARPQKALDFGLFDFPLPENPGIIIADE